MRREARQLKSTLDVSIERWVNSKRQESSLTDRFIELRDCLPNGSWHQQYVKMATRFLDQSWFTGNRVEASWKLTSVN